MAMKPKRCWRAIAAARGDANLRADHDDLAGLADDRPRRSFGRLHGLHGRCLLARPRPGPRDAEAPGGGLRWRRLLAHAARLPRHDRRGQARNLTHLLFKNGVYHTSGAQEIPGGLSVDFVEMAKGAGYRKAYAVTGFRRLQAPPALDAERRGTAPGGAPHRAGGQDADDRPRWSVPSTSRSTTSEEARHGRLSRPTQTVAALVVLV